MKLTPTLRKAAILVNSLDARSADALLEQMGEAQAQRVRNAVMELDDVDPAEQERIINEFLGGKTPAPPIDDGIELGGSLALAMISPTALPIVTAASLPQQPAGVPFAFLQDAASDMLARYLQREHPQTIAVVLAHLPPQRAAAIVRHFPADVQTDVLLRVGDMDDMQMEVVREVERGLEAILAPELQAARKRGNGAATLEAILSAAGETVSLPATRTIVAQQQQPVTAANPRFEIPRPRAAKSRDIAPAEVPQQQPLPNIEFAQLSQLSDAAWAKILRVADAQVSLLALAGASPDLVERLLRQLAPRDAHVLQRKMETLGPVRLRDIEHAQQQLARIAAQLAAQGELRLPIQRPFATAA